MEGREEVLARLRVLVADLDAEYGWQLDEKEQDSYARSLSELIPTQAADSHIRLQIMWYHLDHRQVEQLLGADHHESAEAWKQWIQQIGAILHSSNVPWAATLIHSSEDMIQEILVEVINSLRRFTYNSRLSTWVFAIVNNTVLYHNRKGRAKKRQGATQPINDRHTDTVPDLKAIGPAEAAETALLYERILELLRASPDRRSARILEMHVLEDKTLSVIADMFNISTTRVHGLLKKIYEQLRADPDIQAWWDDYCDT